MRVLVGSAALAHHIDLKRAPKDTDYFVTESVEMPTVSDKAVEVFFHPNLSNWHWSGPVASLNELYTIKASHAFWDLKNGSWDKHMVHMTQMKDAGARILPSLFSFLYPIWEDRYGKKKANLEASPEDFFSNSVSRIYDHDSIHASISYYDEPLFKRILRDDHEVAVSQAKFMALSDEDKIKLVMEEAYATALERMVIPSNYEENYRKAFAWAIKKTVTSFSKGWFPLYIVDNFLSFTKPDVNYVRVHQENKDKLILL